ncbi:MAG: TRAP transporter small permease [Firmicutes bacterium]|nr:TRAP transporter small permease [Bacillota bacterium]
MSKLGKIVRSLVDNWYRLAITISCLIVTLAMLIIVAEVTARKFFNYSIQFVMQFSGYTLFAVTFFAAAWVLREKSHLSVTFVIDNFKQRTRAIHDLILKIIGFLISVFLLYITAHYLVNSVIATGMSTEYPIRFPLAYIFVWMPVGWLFMVIEYLLQIWQDLKSLIKPKQTQNDPMTIEEMGGLS